MCSSSKRKEKILRSAATLCELSDWTICNLQLQKILYLAHMWAIGVEGLSLTGDGQPFQAWVYGPVHPNVYHEVKAYGINPIRSIGGYKPFSSTDVEFRYLKHAMDQVGHWNHAKLLEYIHDKQSAWARVYNNRSRTDNILEEDVKEEFTRRYGKK